MIAEFCSCGRPLGPPWFEMCDDLGIHFQTLYESERAKVQQLRAAIRFASGAFDPRSLVLAWAKFALSGEQP